jgi:hypothetical protein
MTWEAKRLEELVEVEREIEPSSERTERGWQRLRAAVAQGASGAIPIGTSKTLTLSAWFAGKWMASGVVLFVLAGGSFYGIEHHATVPAPTTSALVVRPRAEASPALASTSAASVEIDQPLPVSSAGRSRRSGGGGASARGFEQELALIKAAKTELDAGHSAAALDLLSQHARAYPRGVFAGEREALRALGSCAAGDSASRKKLGTAFIRAYPSSPMVDRVRRACGLDPESSR